MGYKHGTYGDFDSTINPTPTQSGTVPVYVGVAPVHLVRGWKDKDVVNYPAKLMSIDDVKKYFGFIGDWETYTLCEAFSIHFDNEISPAGPIVAINILDPDVHKKSEQKTEQLTFINNIARISSSTIIVDTIVVENAVMDVDYIAEYDFDLSSVVITKLTDAVTDDANVTFSEIDASAVNKTMIVGNKTAGGTYAGLGCLDLVYTDLGIIPNVLAAPGYSHDPEVYKAMIVAADRVNGHWYTWVNADIPVTAANMEAAIAWKKTNQYTSERSKLCWPKWKLRDGRVYHLSTILTWRMTLTDAQNNGIPMETPSNKEIPSGKQYFGSDSNNRGYDQSASNKLNENGITTAVYWGGKTVLWGPHTGAYTYGETVDPRSIFDTNIRMMMHILNSFQSEHAETIDKPMTKALADTIRNREREKLDALVAAGALIGTPEVDFMQEDNPAESVMEGDFTWRAIETSTPPFKSGTFRLAFTTEGFSIYSEDGGEE